MDNLELTRQKWAEEKASGAWAEAARKQAEREAKAKEKEEKKTQ